MMLYFSRLGLLFIKEYECEGREFVVIKCGSISVFFWSIS